MSDGAVDRQAQPSATGNSAVRTLERGLRVIKCFDVNHPSWRIADLGRDVGLHRATARRLVKTLEAEGFLISDPVSGEYRLGSALMSVAYLARSNDLLIQVAHRHVEQLSASTGETVGLSVWTDKGFMLIDHVQTTHFFKPLVVQGSISSTYGTTNSKIFLAFGPEERLSSMTFGDRSRELTVADMERVRRELDEVRESDIAWDLEDYREGVCAVSVPVRDSTGEVVASVTVVVPADRFDSARRESIASQARETGASISRELGFRG